MLHSIISGIETDLNDFHLLAVNMDNSCMYISETKNLPWTRKLEVCSSLDPFSQTKAHFLTSKK